MQTSLTNNYIRTPTKSTVILSSNDVIACYVIVDVANFDLRAKNPRSAPEADGMEKKNSNLTFKMKPEVDASCCITSFSRRLRRRHPRSKSVYQVVYVQPAQDYITQNESKSGLLLQRILGNRNEPFE